MANAGRGRRVSFDTLSRPKAGREIMVRFNEDEKVDVHSSYPFPDASITRIASPRRGVQGTKLIVKYQRANKRADLLFPCILTGLR